MRPKANALFGSLSRFCNLSISRSIKGARAAAPAKRNGLVTLFPPHMRIHIFMRSATFWVGLRPVLASYPRKAIANAIVYVNPSKSPASKMSMHGVVVCSQTRWNSDLAVAFKKLLKGGNCTFTRQLTIG